MDKELHIIYTYKWILNEKLQPDIGYTKGVDTPVIDICRYSVEQANKYGKTILFCDKKSENFWKKQDIPFSKIQWMEELDELDTHHWGLHKLLAMSKYYDGPYIHIDMDIILLKQPKIREDYDVTFGFPAWDFRQGSKIDDTEIEYVNNVYVNTYKKWHKDTHFHLVDSGYMDFGSTPSMCYCQVNNPHLVNQAVNDTLKMGKSLYKDGDYNINQYLEQCVFFSKVKEFCVGKWGWYSDDYTHLQYDNIIGMKDGVPLKDLDLKYLKDYDWIHLAALNGYHETDVKNLIKRMKIELTNEII